MNLYIFGLVDTALNNKQLKAFVYIEVDSTKGGKNIYSMIDTYLRQIEGPTPLSIS